MFCWHSSDLRLCCVIIHSGKPDSSSLYVWSVQHVQVLIYMFIIHSPTPEKGVHSFRYFLPECVHHIWADIWSSTSIGCMLNSSYLLILFSVLDCSENMTNHEIYNVSNKKTFSDEWDEKCNEIWAQRPKIKKYQWIFLVIISTISLKKARYIYMRIKDGPKV